MPYCHSRNWPNLTLISIRLEGHKDARKEKGVAFGLRALVLQFMEDGSDREMARFLPMEVFAREYFLQESTSGKWFCELGLGEKSPDHSYFGDFRKRLGADQAQKT